MAYRLFRSLPLACVLVALGSAPARNEAAPRIIMLYAGMLGERQVFMTNWHENLRLMASVTGVVHRDAEELDRMPMIRAALFWGHQWDAYASDPAKLDSLSPDLAGQHALIYPAREGREALVMFTSAWSGKPGYIRRVDSDGVRLLEGYGIPTSVD